MAIINEGMSVITCDGIIIWDGLIANPHTDEATGSVTHDIRIAIPTSAPEYSELKQLADKTLAESEFKGVLPPGGYWPIGPIDLSKFGDSAPLLAGREGIKAKTFKGIPPVFDANGQELNAMQYGRMIYPGAVVQLLVSGGDYNNVSKGIRFYLEGIRIIDATAPKLDVGGGMSASQVAAAFAGTAAPAPAATGTAPISAPAPAPHPGFVTDAGTAPPPALEVRYDVNGVGYTEAQLIASGWAPVAIAALPRV